jgi:hypothetical protein
LPKESHATLMKLLPEDVLTTDNVPVSDPYSGKQQSLFETWKKTK